jgi:hypothetical protein
LHILFIIILQVYLIIKDVNAEISIAFSGTCSSASRERYSPSGLGFLSVSAVKDTSVFIWQTLSHNTISIDNDDGSWSKIQISINSLSVQNDEDYSTGML